MVRDGELAGEGADVGREVRVVGCGEDVQVGGIFHVGDYI